jgi:hypothetical protein
MSKSIEIRIEVEREFVINRNRNGEETVAFCGQCEKNSQMVSTDEAALIAATNSRSIFGNVEDGTLHHSETEGGLLLICANSLARLVETNSRTKGGQSGI